MHDQHGLYERAGKSTSACIKMKVACPNSAVLLCRRDRTGEKPSIKMHLAMIFCVVMASAGASAGAKELDPDDLKEFRSAFFRSIVRYVAAEYKLLLPVVADQSKNMTGCKTQIMELENDCKTCAKAECLSDMEPGTMDTPSENVEKGGFLKHGNRRVRPKGKMDMDAFSEGLASMFEMTELLAGLFGRRRRSVHIRAMEERRLEFLQKVLRPEVRRCVERCSECVPFLGDREKLLGDVCGQEFLDHQTALKEVLDKIRDLVHANGDAEKGKPQILSKIEYDEATCDVHTSTCAGVYVTAVTPSGVVTYESIYKFNLQFPTLTAEELALELFEKWNPFT